MIAASYRVFGPDRYAPILVFILLCSFAAIALTYRLMLRHAGRPTAVLVTALFAICETCLRYGFQIVTDTPFLVALLIYLLGYERLVGHRYVGRAAAADGIARRERRWLGWLMLPVATLLMVTFRPATMTFVGAVGLATAWHVLRGPSWPIRVRHALVGLLTLACFLGFRAVDPRRQTAGEAVAREARLKTLLTTDRGYALERIVKVTAPAFVEEILPEAVFGMELGTGVDTVASLVVMAAGVALFRQHPLWGAWAAATFFQCMVWLPRERYMLPVLPMLIYGLWRGAMWLTSGPLRSPTRRTGRPRGARADLPRPQPRARRRVPDRAATRRHPFADRHERPAARPTAENGRRDPRPRRRWRRGLRVRPLRAELLQPPAGGGFALVVPLAADGGAAAGVFREC